MNRHQGRILGIKGFKYAQDELLDEMNAVRVQWTAIFYASSYGHGWGGTVALGVEEILQRLKSATDQEEKDILLYALVTMKKSPLAASAAQAIVKPMRYSNQLDQLANSSTPLDATLEKYKALALELETPCFNKATAG